MTDSPSPMAQALDLLGIAADETLSVLTKKPLSQRADGCQVRAGDLRGRLHGDRNVWIGLCPIAPTGIGRGKAQDVVRVPALWADLDVNGDLKPTGGLPMMDAAEAVVAALVAMLGTEPVYVTMTGHGLQPVWALHADDSKDVDRASGVLRRFGELVAMVAQAHGGDADKVSDLARVLRAPGSANHKDPDRPVPTEWTPRGGRPLTLDEVESVLDAHLPPAAEPRAKRRRSRVRRAEKPEVDWPWAATTCRYVAAMVKAWPDEARGVERHYWLHGQCIRLEAARRVGCIAEDDHEDALDALQACSDGLRDGDRPDEVREESLRWAIAEVEAKTEPECWAELGDHRHAGDVSDLTLVYKRLFDFSGVTRTIRDAAFARRVSPLPVLASVLARVIAETPPQWVIPPLVGPDGSLNLACALVGSSGSGKSSSHALADEVLGLRVGFRQAKAIGPGSGEGLVMSFLRWDADTKALVLAETPQALLFADEIGQVDAVQSRAGSSLGPTLRTMLTGGEVSNTNAERERRRHLSRLSYRLSVVVGVQPALSGILLRDQDAGTPQRFVWVPVSGIAVPEVRPAFPEPLEWELPTPESSQWTSSLTPIMRFELPPEVVALVDGERRVALAADPFERADLAAHGTLTRIKVACACAVLHRRTVVRYEDWAWAGDVMVISDHTRERCERVLAESDQSRSRARGRSDALRKQGEREAVAVEDERHARRLWRVVQAGATEGHANMKHEVGAGCTSRCLAFALRNHKGADRDSAGAAAESLGWIDAHTAPSGERRWRPGASQPADEAAR